MTMTREEAINRFKGIRESFSISIAQSKFYPSKAELNELCDMAIESLSAEPSKSTEQNVADVPSGDLISREEAIDVVMKHKMPFTIQQEVARKICALPSADRPTGEWIDREDSTDLFFLYKYECSVCGGKNVLNSSYCPNCGAHMR